jgi:hypothetical protein
MKGGLAHGHVALTPDNTRHPVDVLLDADRDRVHQVP